jgi:hypothetical protein
MSSAPPGVIATAPAWSVIITEWALDSYLDLKHSQVFSDAEYWSTLRPDVERLRGGIPSRDPKFSNPRFWGPAKDGQAILPNGYKMKWRQIGPGAVQLRLPVTTGSKKAFLCEAYVKANANTERRKIARFKTHMNLIARGNYHHRGSL